MLKTQDSFPINRYEHCHNVGLRMYHYARYKLHKTEEYSQEMFLLGCFHDIGYELDPDPFKHDIAISHLLSGDGYKYSKEIQYHSYLQEEYDTPEMRLLYFGDMTVDGFGNWCTVEERLTDIENRHGKDSEVYIESKKIADKLSLWGFDDTVPENITKIAK